MIELIKKNLGRPSKLPEPPLTAEEELRQLRRQYVSEKMFSPKLPNPMPNDVLHRLQWLRAIMAPSPKQEAGDEHPYF